MLESVMERLRDHFTVSQVFGTPIERDGVTVIPVATIAGGGGGGQHRDDSTDDAGGGFGGQARPAGVYEIRGGEVRWRPVIDIQRLAITGAVVVSLFLLTRRRQRTR
jgi:uncharacterized spore protein YtfJ